MGGGAEPLCWGGGHRGESQVREASPWLRKGQGVKLCSLLSKCPRSCVIPCLPSLRTAAPRGLEAGRGPGAGRGRGSFLFAASAPRRPQAGLAAPGRHPKTLAPRWLDRPARALRVPSAAGFSLPLECGVAKNAPSDPRDYRTGQRVRGPGSSDLGAVGGAVFQELSDLRGLRTAWRGRWRGRMWVGVRSLGPCGPRGW